MTNYFTNFVTYHVRQDANLAIVIEEPEDHRYAIYETLN